MVTLGDAQHLLAIDVLQFPTDRALHPNSEANVATLVTPETTCLNPTQVLL